jgi:HSP20 family protein
MSSYLSKGHNPGNISTPTLSQNMIMTQNRVRRAASAGFIGPPPHLHQHVQPNATRKEQMQPAELSENEHCIRLTVDLPGVFARDLEVDVNHGVLSIKGVRKTMSMDGNICIKKHKFSRRYAIDTDIVDVSSITANLAHGVLTIRSPKKSRSEVVRIDVTENEFESDEQIACCTPSDSRATPSQIAVTNYDERSNPPAPVLSASPLPSGERTSNTHNVSDSSGGDESIGE